VEIESTAALQAAFGDRYRLDRELGRGGMATVYLAEDARHGRLVALKVLHAELASSVGPERFRREIALAAQLQHPNILPLLDSGEGAGGPFWFTMPFIEGETLRDRLAREHQLPMADALRITREIASALEYAHRRGLVHRDVKPENILLTRDGRALLADFGLARDLLDLPVDATGTHRLTESGISMGTLEYMSPEQTSGRRDLDGRTDIYALGCVLYEMLAGEPPFTGATPQALVTRRLVERPLPVRAVRDRVSVGVERALDVALARSAADRYPTAAAFAAALDSQELGSVATAGRPRDDDRTSRHSGRRQALTIGVAVVLVAGAAFGALRWSERARASAEPLTLAVLPFESVGEGAVGYFTDGVTDEIRGDLAQLPRLQVIARSSSLLYRASAKPPEQIGRELGADYLLTGEVRWLKRANGTTIARVQPELLLVSRGRAPTVQWQQQFDTDPTNVLEVQAEIASKVASVLDVVLGPSERQALSERPTNNVNAYDAYLQGDAATQALTTTDPPALWRGIGLYTTAVTLDSTFVLAWTRLERAYALLYANSTPNPANADAAHRALVHAKALAPNRLDTQIAEADYVALVEHDDQQALGIMSALLARYPDNVQLLGATSVDERRAGRWTEALAHAQRAAKLDPMSPVAARQLSSILLRMHLWSDAAVACRHGLALAPTNLGMISRMTLLYLAQGDLAGAQGVLRTALSSVDSTRLIVFFATTGDLYWVLTDVQQREILSLPPTAYDDDHASWAIRRAEVFGLRGNSALARVYGDTAARVYADQLKAAPQDYERRMLHALALAYAGRAADAIQEGERGAAMMPISRNAELAPYMQQLLVRVYMMVGEPDRALDHLAPLLTTRYFLTPEWLRIDPTWAPLRGNPRFEQLVHSGPR